MEASNEHEQVNDRFQSLRPLLAAGTDLVYRYLYDMVRTNDVATLEEVPGLLFALEDAEEEVGILTLSPSEVCQALADLFRVTAELESELEGAEPSEDE